MPVETKYKVGDKVKHQGKTWTVVENWVNTCFGVVLCKLSNPTETVTWTNQNNLEKVSMKETPTFKVGDKVLCINGSLAPAFGLEEGGVYTVVDCRHYNRHLLITLEELPRAGGFFACRFELYIEESTNESKVIASVVDQLTNPPKDLPTDNQEIPKGNTPHFIISHFDGESVKTEMKIAGHVTWMKVLQEFVSFLRGIGYQIKNKDIALHIDRYPSDWQGKHYVD